MMDDAGVSPADTPRHLIDAGSPRESTSSSAAGAEAVHDAETAQLLHDPRAFRAAAAQVTALLIRSYGAQHLARIEDAVQEAFVAAARAWSVSGRPRAPMAWLTTVAQRRYLDLGRPDKRLVDDPTAGTEIAAPGDSVALEPLADDELRLLFLCCHPALSSESRVALTLKCAVQFSVEEIARLLRVDARAVAQRVVRAKRTLQEHRASFVLPSPAELQERLRDVLAVCYAMFAEGHLATQGEDLVRPDLCGEALRLVALLVAWPPTAQPETHALHALLCLTAARLPARQDPGDDGAVIPLARQDRARWNRALIEQGIRAIDRSASGQHYSRYHAEAEIAALHALAPSWEATDWPAVVRVYDRLLALAPTDSVRLSRWVAMAEAGLAMAAWEEMQRAHDPATAPTSPWAEWHATQALLATRAGLLADAVAAYERALALPASAAVHRFWWSALQQLRGHS